MVIDGAAISRTYPLVDGTKGKLGARPDDPNHSPAMRYTEARWPATAKYC